MKLIICLSIIVMLFIAVIGILWPVFLAFLGQLRGWSKQETIEHIQDWLFPSKYNPLFDSQLCAEIWQILVTVLAPADVDRIKKYKEEFPDYSIYYFGVDATSSFINITLLSEPDTTEKIAIRSAVDLALRRALHVQLLPEHTFAFFTTNLAGQTIFTFRFARLHSERHRLERLIASQKRLYQPKQQSVRDNTAEDSLT